MTRRYIAFDVETGGIGHDKSLLTVYFQILDENLRPFEFQHTVRSSSLYLAVKPNDGIYHVTAEALGINGINLKKHDQTAITAKEAGTLLYNFLKVASDDARIKLIPLGHHVWFDVEFVCKSIDSLMSKNTWEHFCSYRVIDTGSIAQFLQAANKIPSSVSGSLSSLARHFGIDSSGAHDAQADVDMTVGIYKKMIELVK